MAKVKQSIIPLTGKYGDDVVVRTKHGTHLRKTPKEHNKKYSSKFTDSKKRTPILNNLAGEINRWTDLYYSRLKSDDFYVRVLKAFRTEPLNDRYVLLQTLQKFELNPDYPLEKLGDCEIKITEEGDKLLIELEVKHHPSPGRYQANCYYNDLLLICWTKNDKSAMAEKWPSDWISLRDEKPVFDFEFKKPDGANHWMLFLRQRLGKNNSTFDINSLTGEGMRVAAIGSFDKEDVSKLKQLYAEREASIIKEKRNDEEEGEKRVKARKKGK